MNDLPRGALHPKDALCPCQALLAEWLGVVRLLHKGRGLQSWGCLGVALMGGGDWGTRPHAWLGSDSFAMFVDEGQIKAEAFHEMEEEGLFCPSLPQISCISSWDFLIPFRAIF